MPPMVWSHERALSLDGRGEGEMLVETIARIRRDHLVRGVPIKKIARGVAQLPPYDLRRG